MKISKLSIKNFRSLKQLEDVKISDITTIVGKNDSGKSSILCALDVFFNEQKIDDNDFYATMSSVEESIEITVSFNNLPSEIELEKEVRTTLSEENLLNQAGELELTKIFLRSNPKKPKIILNVYDFQEDRFNNLCSKKASDLESLGNEIGLEMTRSGRSITNKDKRAKIRNYASSNSFSKAIMQIEPNVDLTKNILDLLPKFSLFHADTKLGIGETSFQNEFKEIVQETIKNLDRRDEIENKIKNGLKSEFDKILTKLQQHTDSIAELEPSPEFLWDKLVKFDLDGIDEYGFKVSMDKRGSGTRRMLMVAFFQYLADKNKGNKETNFIYTIEEPEAFIHPGLQRELARSFNELAENGYQIILSSHSPVFAGFSPVEKLILLKRESGITKALQTPVLDLDEVAHELGVEPSDQIAIFRACVFIEGETDFGFWKYIFDKLKGSGKIDSSFEDKDKNIGFIPLEGCNNVKHYVNRKLLKGITKNFLVILDSDKESENAQIPQDKLEWQKECEKDGGKLIFLKKREIENYLHPEALKRAGESDSKLNNFDYDYGDIKKEFSRFIKQALKQMTAEEILERGNYEDTNGEVKNEILEIVNEILSLV